MTGSGEHTLELETRDTEPAPRPPDPEARVPTWPKMRAVREDLLTDILTGQLLEDGDE